LGRAWNARSLTDEPVVRHSRWHGVRRAARPQGNRNLAAGRPWRADGQKVLLAVKAWTRAVTLGAASSTI